MVRWLPKMLLIASLGGLLLCQAPPAVHAADAPAVPAAAAEPAPATPAAAAPIGAPAGEMKITPAVVSLGKRLCEEGDRFLKAKRYADAEACYRVVLLFLKDSTRAKAGLRRAQAGGR